MKLENIQQYAQRIDGADTGRIESNDGVITDITGYGFCIDEHLFGRFEADNSGEIYYIQVKTSNENDENDKSVYFWIKPNYDLTYEDFIQSNEFEEYIPAISENDLLDKISHSTEFLNGLVTDSLGNKYWYTNNKLHREDGPAIEESDGDQHWYKNGMSHRDNGPATIYKTGSQYWYQNGQLHREDGPAEINERGQKSWYLYGEEFSKEEFQAIRRYKEIEPVHQKKIVDVAKFRDIHHAQENKDTLNPKV